MNLRWILPLCAALTLGGLLWTLLPGAELTPQQRLDSARARLAARPQDVTGALRDLEEALRGAEAKEWKVLRPAILRERSRLYEARGLQQLSLADCLAELDASGPHAETLARAADLSLALGDAGRALELSQRLAQLAPARGRSRVGRAHLALADAPLAEVERLAHSSLTVAASSDSATLAQRAAVFAGRSSSSAIALEDLVQRFAREEDRKRVEEWVREASEHLALAGDAFANSLDGATGDAVAGMQDLLRRGGDERAAVDLGLVALAIPTLPRPMPVLARTAGALASLGRHELARALVLDVRQRNPTALRPEELSVHGVESELESWVLLLARLGLWDDLRLAGVELWERSGRSGAAGQLAAFHVGLAEMAKENFGAADNWLQNIGSTVLAGHDVALRTWLLRASIGRKQGRPAAERSALLMATKLAPLDPREQPMRSDLGRAWQRLYELQLQDNDVLAAEISLTHALRCSSERAAELEPLWHELGRKALATRGAAGPYFLYARSRGADERGEYRDALDDAEAVLADYPGLGPALEVVSRTTAALREYPRMVSASLELLERGWRAEAASARLRAVPPEAFLPRDRVRWLQIDPRGSLREVLARLREKGDVAGAALASRSAPPGTQPPELLPELAQVQYEAGLIGPALQSLDALPADSAPFRSCAGLALLVGLERWVQSGQAEALQANLAKTLASGEPRDERLLAAFDALLGTGRREEAAALLAWLEGGPFHAERLVRAAALRAVEGETLEVDQDLERAAALVEDGGVELGRIVLASARHDREALAREAQAALSSPLAAEPGARAALLLLADEDVVASDALASDALDHAVPDGRDFLLELASAALDARVRGSGSDAEGPPSLSPLLLESVTPARLLVLALASEHAPWSAWTLARTQELAPEARSDPWLRAVRARCLLALGRHSLALAELGPPGDVARVEWTRARIERARGASEEEVRAAELAWLAAAPPPAGGDDVERLLLATYRMPRDDAARSLDAALETHAGDVRLLARLAELESVPGRRTRAIELYAELLAALPPRTDEPEVLRFLDVLRAARDEGEIAETRWWAEVEALEAERPRDPALPRELAARSFERPVTNREQARNHALQRLARFRTRSLVRPLESLRAGEVARWTELLARYSPERALEFVEDELLRDPSDPALWRSSAQALLALGRWKHALQRLVALQQVAPERDTGRLLALTSFRIERDPLRFQQRLADIERYDEDARSDPAIEFYVGLNSAGVRKANADASRGAAGRKNAAGKNAGGKKGRAGKAEGAAPPGATPEPAGGKAAGKADAKVAQSKPARADAPVPGAEAESAARQAPAPGADAEPASPPAVVAQGPAPEGGGAKPAAGEAPAEGAAAESDAAVPPEPDKLERSFQLWKARDENGLADAEHGRALALALFDLGRREKALQVLADCDALARDDFERDVLATLAFLMRAAPAAPRRLIDAPLPRRPEEIALEGAAAAPESVPAPGRARANRAAGGKNAAGAKGAGAKGKRAKAK